MIGASNGSPGAVHRTDHPMVGIVHRDRRWVYVVGQIGWSAVVVSRVVLGLGLGDPVESSSVVYSFLEVVGVG